MDQFTQKQIKSSRGFTYTYYVFNPNSSNKPALVFCHGWPDCHSLWESIVPPLLDLGHPLLIPDLLGYAGTSKPTDIQDYNSRGMADDIYEVIDNENLSQIIPVGHDWGSWMAQRLYIYRPERCSGLISLNVAYMPPDQDRPFDLEATLNLMEKFFGYPSLAYWDVFAADDGPQLLLDNIETLFHMLHWNDPEAMKQVFCTRGATRKMLQSSSPDDYPLKRYAQQANFASSFLQRMRRDGFEAPQCWYKAMLRNVQFETEKEIPKENLMIRVPVLYVGATEDAVCRPELMQPVRHLVPDLEEHMVEANHWCTYEKPEEVRAFMVEWLKKRF